MSHSLKITEQRLRMLEEHLRAESPYLVEVVASFRLLDDVARSTGLLSRNDSFATQVSWWPLVSVLGTFSAGKSAFVNYYLGQKLQRTGNQAVDDRFTVICYGTEERTLPGVALDSDLRFPFFGISEEIESAVSGEGRRIDSYLQLKTCSSEKLRGRILIDSPGFDADAQRTSTLRIIDQIIDLSDLVLVFFDARHPEPGAMRDTLEHLVSKTIERSDAAKFLFVLNQIDTSMRDDNSEEVVASWQRALAEAGLTAGRFFVVYNPEMAEHGLAEEQKERLQKRLSSDMTEVLEKVENVGVSRAYRIVSTLEKISESMIEDSVPKILEARSQWRTRVLMVDVLLFAGVLAGAYGIGVSIEPWEDLWQRMQDNRGLMIGAIAAVIIAFLVLHHIARNLLARPIAARLRKEDEARGSESRGSVAAAFEKGLGPWRSVMSGPPGCGAGNMKRLRDVQSRALKHVQQLNESYTNPSG